MRNFPRPTRRALVLGVVAKVGAAADGRAQLPPETDARLQALHRTTPAALRVLVLHGDG